MGEKSKLSSMKKVVIPQMREFFLNFGCFQATLIKIA